MSSRSPATRHKAPMIPIAPLSRSKVREVIGIVIPYKDTAAGGSRETGALDRRAGFELLAPDQSQVAPWAALHEQRRAPAE